MALTLEGFLEEFERRFKESFESFRIDKEIASGSVEVSTMPKNVFKFSKPLVFQDLSEPVEDPSRLELFELRKYQIGVRYNIAEWAEDLGVLLTLAYDTGRNIANRMAQVIVAGLDADHKNETKVKESELTEQVIFELAFRRTEEILISPPHVVLVNPSMIIQFDSFRSFKSKWGLRGVFGDSPHFEGLLSGASVYTSGVIQNAIYLFPKDQSIYTTRHSRRNLTIQTSLVS